MSTASTAFLQGVSTEAEDRVRIDLDMDDGGLAVLHSLADRRRCPLVRSQSSRCRHSFATSSKRGLSTWAPM